MHNPQRSLFTATLCCAFAFGLPACDDETPGAPTQEASDATITPAELGMAGDWIEVELGLWSLADGEGNQQFVAIGEPGRLHAIASLEEVEAAIEEILAKDETEEVRRQLEELDTYITELRVTELPPAAEVAPRCNPSVGTTVDAYPSSCGVSAKASASYSHCSNWGTVRSFAQASCGYDTKSHACGPKAGSPVTCSSNISISGSGPCKSYASAQINAPGVYVFMYDENFQRGACGSEPGSTSGPGGGLCGACTAGKDCHCGDVCRPIDTLCP